MEKKSIITLRAHHLINLCVHAFLKAGRIELNSATQDAYSYKFAAEVSNIFTQIVGNKRQLVRLICGHQDDICHHCPLKDKGCNTLSGALADDLTIQFYGLETERVYSSEFLLGTLKDKGVPDIGPIFQYMKRHNIPTDIPKS